MGKISRLKLITMARIEAFLADLEKPEQIIPQLIREMAKKVDEAARAEAKALSAVRGDRKRLDAVIGKIERFRKGAQLALKAQDETTARQAVAAQIDAEKQLDMLRNRLTTCETAYKSATDVRKKLQTQLEELKFKKDEILIRVEQIKNKKQIQKVNGSLISKTKDILEAVTKIENDIEEKEALIEIQDEITQTLGTAFEHERARELEKDAEVDNRLKTLKNEIAKND